MYHKHGTTGPWPLVTALSHTQLLIQKHLVEKYHKYQLGAKSIANIYKSIVNPASDTAEVLVIQYRYYPRY